MFGFERFLVLFLVIKLDSNSYEIDMLPMQIPPVDQADGHQALEAAAALQIPVCRIGMYTPGATHLQLELVSLNEEESRLLSMNFSQIL